jgi:hypothetical protein
MRGVLLRDCLRSLRAEIGHSTSVVTGMNAEDALVTTLERTQKRLWEEWDWPHLMVRRIVPMAAGSRYYNVPADLYFEKIRKAEIRYSGEWRPVEPGIDECHYLICDSDIGQRSHPVERYQVTEDPQDTGGNVDGRGMVEVWPIPDSNYSPETLEGALRFHGIRTIRRFSEPTDRCELDDSLIVLYSAAEILARQRSADAEIKLAHARKLELQLRGQGQRTKSFQLGATEDCGREFWPHHPLYVNPRP